MARCTEPDCPYPAVWSAGYKAWLCDRHLLARFTADLERSRRELAAHQPRLLSTAEELALFGTVAS